MGKTNNPPSRKALTPSAASNSGAGAKGAAPEPKPEPSTALYGVGATPVLLSGAYHAPLSTIELTEAEAARLGLSAAVSTDTNLE